MNTDIEQSESRLYREGNQVQVHYIAVNRGLDLGDAKDREALSIVDAAGALIMLIDRDDFNAKRASRKADREYIAAALIAIVSRHGAKVTKWDKSHRREISLTFDLKGVGALIHIDDLFDGGSRSPIHWHNTEHPARNFTTRFCVAVGEGPCGRPHHKATSIPGDWYSLAMTLDAGLCLAFADEAFAPVSGG